MFKKNLENLQASLNRVIQASSSYNMTSNVFFFLFFFTATEPMTLICLKIWIFKYCFNWI